MSFWTFFVKIGVNAGSYGADEFLQEAQKDLKYQKTNMTSWSIWEKKLIH